MFLNEGLATYMEFIGTQHTHPEYDSRRKFLYEALQTALLYDAGPSSRALLADSTNEQIKTSEVFDEISYLKGASLLRMVENVVGEELLFQGLRNYLKEM